MRVTPIICLLSASLMLGGCFNRDNNHPAKDADPSKPSLQMQKPDAPVTAPAQQSAPAADKDN